MIEKVPRSLEKYRLTRGPLGSDESCGPNGMFIIPYKKKELRVVSSDEMGWDHVSVSIKNQIPSWNIMSYVKNLFFKKDEIAFQLHPAEKDHINVHPYCLHLWRCQYQELELPPKFMVA